MTEMSSSGNNWMQYDVYFEHLRFHTQALLISRAPTATPPFLPPYAPAYCFWPLYRLLTHSLMLLFYFAAAFCHAARDMIYSHDAFVKSTYPPDIVVWGWNKARGTEAK